MKKEGALKTRVRPASKRLAVAQLDESELRGRDNDPPRKRLALEKRTALET